MKATKIVAGASLLAIAGYAQDAKAEVSTERVRDYLKQATCLQEWDKAAVASGLLIASESITPEHRQQLVDWRYRFSDYAANDTQFERIPNCEGVVAIQPESEEPRFSAPPPTVISSACYRVTPQGQVENLEHLCGQPEERVPQEQTAVTAAENTSPDPLPLAGTTCSDFATQGEAQWHYLFGSAPASLDGDSDGIACEGLTMQLRAEGTRAFRNQNINGLTLEIWRVSAIDHYLKINASTTEIARELDEVTVFTTRSFASSDEALAHANTYYGDILSRQ